MITIQEVENIKPRELIKVRSGNCNFEGYIDFKYEKTGCIKIDDVSGKGAVIPLKFIDELIKV